MNAPLGPTAAEIEADSKEKYEPHETVLANDLRAIYDGKSGFAHVTLYDADDYERFYLGEDELLSLRDYLNKLYDEKKLPV